MFDSHCHLDFAAFDGDRPAVWAAAQAAGVTGLVVPAYGPAGWDGVLATAQGLAGVHAALGLHPWALGELSDVEVEAALAALPAKLRQGGAVALGECGLDGVVAKAGGATLDAQRAALEHQLRIARELSLPVILHVVRAHGLALEVLRAHAPLPAGGVLHSYGGAAELVREYVALGLSLSFSPSVTRERARRVREAAAEVPDAMLLVESDGPEQALPDAERGEPRDVVRVCEALAALRGTSVEHVQRVTQANARALFRL